MDKENPRIAPLVMACPRCQWGIQDAVPLTEVNASGFRELEMTRALVASDCEQCKGDGLILTEEGHAVLAALKPFLYLVVHNEVKRQLRHARAEEKGAHRG